MPFWSSTIGVTAHLLDILESHWFMDSPPTLTTFPALLRTYWVSHHSCYPWKPGSSTNALPSLQHLVFFLTLMNVLSAFLLERYLKSSMAPAEHKIKTACVCKQAWACTHVHSNPREHCNQGHETPAPSTHQANRFVSFPPGKLPTRCWAKAESTTLTALKLWNTQKQCCRSWGRRECSGLLSRLRTERQQRDEMEKVLGSKT